LNLIQRYILHSWVVQWHLLVEAIKAAEDLILNACNFLPKNRPLIGEIDTVVEGLAQTMKKGLVLSEAERCLAIVVDVI